MEDQIRKVLKEKVVPVLAAHYGGAVLTGYEDGIVYVKLTGACGTSYLDRRTATTGIIREVTF